MSAMFSFTFAWTAWVVATALTEPSGSKRMGNKEDIVDGCDRLASHQQ